MISKRDVLTGGSALLGSVLFARVAQAAAKPEIVHVPITLASDGKPVLSLTIDGKGPFSFVLDTGAEACVIKEPIAKQLGLHTAGAVKTGSIKGNESSYVYVGENLVIGGRLPLPRMSFVGAANFPSKTVDGLLPASFLTFLPSQLDYEAKEIRYYVGGADMDLMGFDKAPAFFQADFDGGTEKVYVEVNFDGRKLVCCLDTGAAANLLVFSGIVDRYKIWDKYPVLRESRIVGVNGKSLAARIVQGPNVSLGTLKIATMPVTLGDPKEFEEMSDTHDGVIGTPFLRHFIVAFGADKALYFKPNNSFPSLSNILPDSLIPDAPVTSPDQPAVPFLYGDDRRIVVPGRVGNGPAFTCLLDTALVASSIGTQRAAELSLPVLPSGEFDGSNIIFSTVRLPKLKLKPRNNAPNANPQLGLDFLTLLPTGIDSDHNLLTFFIKTQPDLTGYVRLPAERRPGDGRFQMKATLAGREITCLIDTQAQMFILLPPATTRAWGIWDSLPNAENRMVGNNSGYSAKARFGRMQGFDFAGLHVEDVPVTLVDPAAQSDAAAGPFEATLGMGLLHRLNMIFAGDGSIWVKPNSFWTDAKPGQSPSPGTSVPPPAN